MQTMPASIEATEEQLINAQKALNKAKIRMMTCADVTFFTAVCFFMEHRFDTSMPTAGTDGKQIIFNPHFFLSLDAEEQVFLLLHETMHVAFLHTRRVGNKSRGRYNRAADYVINWFLTRLGFKMIAGGLLDAKYRDMSTDETYELLEEDPDEDAKCHMDIMPDNNDCGADKDDLDEILIKAHTITNMNKKNAGTLPEEISIYIQNLLAPRLPWHRILAKYMTALVKNNYSYRKPNRRFFPEHILPTRSSNGLDDITMFCDTSGSVTQKNFDHVCAETMAIFKTLKPKKLTFVQFDTQIKNSTALKSIKDFLGVKFTGRGGTRILPVLEQAKKEKPKLAIIFTDGHFTKEDFNPGVPIIWLVYDNQDFTYPFGKVIHYHFGD